MVAILRYVVLPFALFAGALIYLSWHPRIGLPIGGLLIAWIAISVVRRRLDFKRRGYQVRKEGRDQFMYEEVGADGKSLQLLLDGQMLLKGKHEIYLPSQAAWNHSVPGWAHDRREDIVARIVECLGTKKHRIVEASDSNSGVQRSS